MTLKNLQGFPCWPNRLRIQHCHCSSSGHCCGTGLIPGQGTSACCRRGQKKPKQQQQQKRTPHNSSPTIAQSHLLPPLTHLAPEMLNNGLFLNSNPVSTSYLLCEPGYDTDLGFYLCKTGGQISVLSGLHGIT